MRILIFFDIESALFVYNTAEDYKMEVQYVNDESLSIPEEVLNTDKRFGF
ncbi:MAG: hypothetical protein Q9M91_03180 [Candidatus Dojkabacteria bacterium]|nr:hypothetical protein [Candidatus Dojkabacteria bacterium]MDQ7020826.1 hypothetical protein [Candidatus Dojkabacteria bacterium]